jgi:hypothetical protein
MQFCTPGNLKLEPGCTPVGPLHRPSLAPFQGLHVVLQTRPYVGSWLHGRQGGHCTCIHWPQGPPHNAFTAKLFLPGRTRRDISTLQTNKCGLRFLCLPLATSVYPPLVYYRLPGPAPPRHLRRESGRVRTSVLRTTRSTQMKVWLCSVFAVTSYNASWRAW